MCTSQWFEAVRVQDIEKVKSFIHSGVDVNQPDVEGIPALFAATMDGNLELTRVLLEAGADVNAADEGGAGFSALMSAIMGRNADVVKVLLESGAEINARDTEFGRTSLACAVQFRYTDIVNCLLIAGADANVADNAGLTPLCYAAESGYSNIVESLLDHGADPNWTGHEGITPLIVAADRGRARVVRLLLKAHADLHARDDKYQYTARQFAANKGHTEIVRVLREAENLRKCGPPLRHDDSATMIAQCPHCKSKFKARDELKGKRTKCPKCSQPFTIELFKNISAKEPHRDHLSKAIHKTAEALAGGPAPAIHPGVPVSTNSPNEALSLLFERALPVVSVETEDNIRYDYAKCQNAWGSRELFEGDENEIRETISRNLHRIAREPEFEVFDVTVHRDATSAQINSIFRQAFVPIKLWRSDGRLFACGNTLFA